MSRRPTSPLHGSASSSRNPSVISQTQHHAPITPSGLRESVTIARSPEDVREGDDTHGGRRTMPSSSEPSPNTYPTHLEHEPDVDEQSLDDGETHSIAELGSKAVTETTALLRKPFEFAIGTPAHNGPCNHGTFSPRLESRADSVRSGHSGFGFGGSPPRRTGSGEESGGILGGMFGPRRSTKKMSTTSYLAERHGITNTRTMYVCLCPQRELFLPVLFADLCASTGT